MSCSVVDLDEIENEVQFKSNGINKLFHLAILHPKLEENHHNINIVLSHLNMIECRDKFKGTFLIGGDFKVYQFFVGKQNHACSYPDFACMLKQDQKKSMHGKAPLLTIGKLIDMHKAFVESGLSRSELKDIKYQNCEFPQLLVKEEQLNSEIRLKNVLDYFLPPTLHIEIGAFDCIFKLMKVEWPECAEWPILCNVVPDTYFGKEGNFSGTQVRALLKPSKFATLLRISTTPPYNPHSALFIRTLLGLKNVIDSIFGNTYNEDWQNILNEFQECILELDTKLGLTADA